MQRKIILFITILFILSSAYLFAIGSKFESLNFGKNWWAIYFEDPKSDSLNFVIENHSDNINFHYVIYQDKEKISEGDARAGNGKIENIKPTQNFASQNIKAGNITIEVSAGEGKKEIYKNLQ